MISLATSRRLRRTPFSEGVEAAGITAYTVYNHMLLPSVFESVEADYHHLKRHVQVWDVSCERQIELRGPDAGRLMQLLTPRDLGKVGEGRCCYVPIVDHAGFMLNDPVALKLEDDRWWISIADSDLLLWVKGIAQGGGFDVQVSEPDVSPLAVQGPQSDTLMERVFGDAVRDLGFFHFGRFTFEGRPLVVARSGYSRQGGFEIYVEGSDIGMPLWRALFAAGRDLQVRAGCPNLIERIEGGLLSYGNDMRGDNTPFECGLGKFCQPQAVADCIGRDALLRAQETGPTRQIRAIEIAGHDLPRSDRAWPLLAAGQRVGQVTSAAWSPDFGVNVAIGMVDASHWDAGTELQVETAEGHRAALVRAQFWA
ncbi:dimethylsulfoniopropionate demethylase [Sulfitobacter aestuarii]|uniref:Dimethylsulfoniopropionate demethylase n=1 Tax=Sulfitobacter aestuarii TaxID=2161676 RepID=A0ABW5U5J1_9RHOB